MRTFKEWAGQVFSATPETRSNIVYSQEREKYFWIVHAHNWENISRTPGWYAITLRDHTESANLLGGTPRMDFSLENRDIMDRLKKCDPDMENREPDTKVYQDREGALNDLLSSF